MPKYFTTAERAAFVQAHGNKCDQCGATGEGVTLHAHHSTYAELPDMLLCASCHRLQHTRGDAPSLPRKAGTTNIHLALRLPEHVLAAMQAEAELDGVSRNELLVNMLTAWARAHGYTEPPGESGPTSAQPVEQKGK